MRSLVRRVTLVLILSAVLVPGLAQAGPRVSAAEPTAGAFTFLWEALFGWMKNGAEVDPDGVPAALSDNGAELDPNGATAPSDNGAEVDPNGRT